EKRERMEAVGTVLLLHLDGQEGEHRLALMGSLLKRWDLCTVDLRGTGAAKPAGDVIAGAPDHTSAEHALWVGRPLLGQWIWDVRCLLEWLGSKKDVAVIGVRQAG